MIFMPILFRSVDFHILKKKKKGRRKKKNKNETKVGGGGGGGGESESFYASCTWNAIRKLTP